MKKITELTPEQQQKMVAFREEWRAVGLATGPADMDEVRRVINKFYARIGQPAPLCIRCPSPLTIQVLVNLLKRDNLSAALEHTLGHNLGETLRDTLLDTLGDTLEHNLSAALWDTLQANLEENLRDNLRANLSAALWDTLGANLGDNLEHNLRENLWDALQFNLREPLRDNLSAALWDTLGANLGDNLENTLQDNLSANLRDNLSAALRDNLRTDLRDNLWDTLGDTLGANLRENLWDALLANLWDTLQDNLSANLRDNLRTALRDTLRDNLSANLYDKISVEYTCLWGSLDAYWIGYYLYPQLYLRPMYSDDQLELLNDWAALARSSYWIYPYTGICFVSDRPTQLHQDGNYRLHNADGPAVAFSDGWQEYYIRGVHVPAWLIEQPDLLSAQKIDAETNAEIRRIMIERYTAERYLQDGSAALVSDDQYGRLWRKSVPDDEDIVMVEVTNATPEPDGSRKHYWLRVSPNVKTAHEAVASTWVDENNQPIFADYRDYQPIFES